jgi:hypothetical protein
MPFDVILAAEAVEDLKSIKAHGRAAVRTALEIHLRHEPEEEPEPNQAIARIAPTAIQAARRRYQGVL